MLDILEKTICTGMGLAALTKKKVEEVARELVEKRKLSEKEGRELLEDLLKRSEDARKNLEKLVKKEVRKVIKKLDIPSRSELRKLAARVRNIRKTVTNRSDTDA